MSIPQFMTDGLKQEWGEKISSAKLYLAALDALMSSIVEGIAADIVLQQLDQCRLSNAVLGAEQAVKEAQARTLSAASLSGAIEYLEILKAIRSSESLVREWLATDSDQVLSPDLIETERLFGLKADPRFDFFVFDESDAHLIDAYRVRGYPRTLLWSDLSKLEGDITGSESDPGRIDVKRMDERLNELPDVLQCRPARSWFISRKKDASLVADVTKELEDRAQAFYINRNTVQKWGASWVRQFVSNLPALTRQGRCLFDLAKSFAGSGAIVVGAGPSLDSAIDWIKAQESKPLIICAFKALKALTSKGITPDFVVLLDPNQKLRHLEGVETSGIAAFVVEVAVQPDVMAAIDRPLLPYAAGAPTAMLAETLKFPMPARLVTGGSAIHAALQFAVSIGCDEITLIGGDFGFPDARLYAEGAGRGDVFAISDDGRSYLRAPTDADKRVGSLIEVLANDGQTINCSLELNQYRIWTEQFIREVTAAHPETSFFNLSESGAVILGAPYVSPSSHRPKARSADPLPIINALKPHVAVHDATREIKSGLVQQARRLRALGKTCQRAASLTKDGAVRARQFKELSRRAEECPEVSLMMSDELIRLEEGVRRGHIWVEGRLVELADTTRRYCDEISALCSRVEKTMPTTAT